MSAQPKHLSEIPSGVLQYELARRRARAIKSGEAVEHDPVISLATFSELWMELSCRCKSFVIGYVRINPKSGEHLPCVGYYGSATELRGVVDVLSVKIGQQVKEEMDRIVFNDPVDEDADDDADGVPHD